MKIGIVKTSLKENERRVSIYPENLARFSKPLLSQMVFERGYGIDFGFPDEYLLSHGATVAERVRLFSDCDMLVLPKPMPADLARMKPRQILFGWPHCVQQVEIAQTAINRQLTLIAWEAMHQWNSTGEKQLHVFYKNNELAGYAAILHSLQLLGIDGHYGPRRKVVVLGFGSVSRGAIYALHGRGFNNIHVFTRRPAHLVADQNPDVYHGQFYSTQNGKWMALSSDGSERPLIDELATADIICNGVLQDPVHPMVFVNQHEVARLKPRSLIVDISCDLGMGFAFARPTTFASPVFQVGEGVTYYSVDHTPTYLWNAASREISKALLPYLPLVAEGPTAWETSPTIMKAVEIRDGVVQNRAILTFQNRRSEYPHEKLSACVSSVTHD